MSGGHDPLGLPDKLMAICLTLLGASIALYCAMKVVQAILPFLVAVIGIGALIWIGIVVYKTWRERF
ncbi:hypothetical protein ACWDSJ_35895 [Nocardia sp. NPDC003482]